MGSIAAREMAKEVLETLGKGEIPNLGKIARKKGYSQNTSDNPKEITKSKSYKEVIFPVVLAMENERNRIIESLSKRKLSKEKYRDMIDGVDKLTKNIQLLNGGKTSNEGLEISWE